MDFWYQINPRISALGGGWRLRLLQRDASGKEIEMGGGVFPLENGSEDDAYADAVQVGEAWVKAQGATNPASPESA